MRAALALAVLVASTWFTPALAQTGGEVGRLLRDVESRDFDRAHAAVEKLREHPAARAQTVPALIQALSGREWDRCSADARDAIARTLAALKAREAVTPLLDLVKSGKPIDHECFE